MTYSCQKYVVKIGEIIQ